MDLENDKIPKLIGQIAIPAIVGLFFSSMFNVVDTYWGGVYSTTALAALSLSFPVFFLIIAFGSGLSTGAASLISNSLGAKKPAEAGDFAAQAISFGAIASIVITIVGLLISPYLFTLLGARGEYLNIALQFMNMTFYASVFYIALFVFSAILNSLGNTKTYRNFLILGFFLNIILDPLFMFGFHMGVAGVAFSTNVVQFIGCLYLGWKIMQTDFAKHMHWKNFIPRKYEFTEINRQGFPASLNMVTIGLGVFIITFFISQFGKNAVAAYGIATRVEQIFLLPVLGITIATLVLTGYFNGAKNFQKIREVLQKTIRYSLYINTIAAIIIFSFSKQFMMIFTNDVNIISIGANYLKIAAFITWAYSLLFVNVSALQGLKRPMYAIWIGLFRQIVAPVIVFYILVNIFNLGIYGVWIGVFLIVWLSALITIFYTKYVIKNIDIKSFWR